MTKLGDRYGYYQIGDVKTYSRYELMDIHHVSPQAWKWNYNDEFFSRYDWHIEPDDTLDELYKKRAEQLRKDYDYLILYYSGGHDSVNMLNAFLDNDIPVDEVCVLYSKIDKVSSQYKELQTITWDKFDRLKDKHKNITFRKLDYTDYFFRWYEDLKSLNLDKDPIHMFGISMSINRLVSDLLFKNVEPWKKLLENGKKIAWIYGVDKPTIRFNDNKWIFNFHDALVQWNVTPMWQMIDDGTIGTQEFFYWAPQHESAMLLIKQCHLVKRYYSELINKDFSKIFKKDTYIEGYGWNIDKNSLPFLNILYPRNFLNNEKYYVMDLLNLHVLGDRDQWYINTQLPGSQIHWQLYQSIVNDFGKEHYRPWYKDKKSINSGFHNAISKNYII